MVAIFISPPRDIKMLKITKNDVRIRIEAEEELDSFSHAAKECAPGFEEAVKSMLKKSKRWGWCCVKVTVNLKNGPTLIEGTSYLGHCSYSSRSDFIENSGYYDQMVDDAIEDLAKNLNSHIEKLTMMVDEMKHFDQEIRNIKFEA